MLVSLQQIKNPLTRSITGAATVFLIATMVQDSSRSLTRRVLVIRLSIPVQKPTN